MVRPVGKQRGTAVYVIIDFTVHTVYVIIGNTVHTVYVIIGNTVHPFGMYEIIDITVV